MGWSGGAHYQRTTVGVGVGVGVILRGGGGAGQASIRHLARKALAAAIPTLNSVSLLKAGGHGHETGKASGLNF